jgi:hypothetical protein
MHQTNAVGNGFRPFKIVEGIYEQLQPAGRRGEATSAQGHFLSTQTVDNRIALIASDTWKFSFRAKCIFVAGKLQFSDKSST